MTTIAASIVNDLRKQTNCPMSDCKKALVDANGDFDIAKKLLRERLGSLDTSKPNSGKEGLIVASMKNDDESVYCGIVQIDTETDFAANNPQVIAISQNIANNFAELSKLDVSGFENDLAQLRSITGENINLRKADYVSSKNYKDGAIYIHHNRKISSVVFFSGKVDEEVKKSIAMHIVASSPSPICIKPEDVPEHAVASEKSYLEDKASKSGKPQAIQDKIVHGGLSKFKNSISLLEQDFVKETSKKVKDILPEGIEILYFIRHEVA